MSVDSIEPRSRGSVLLAEDAAPLRRALKRMLETAGYVVVDAPDGGEAALLARAQDFDVIVSDISMPGMDGIQLLRSVRERNQDIPVILITGAPDVATATAAIAHGVFRYLAKPVDSQTLKDVVKQAVDLHRLARLKREAFARLGDEGAASSDRNELHARFETAMGTLWIAYQPIVRASDRSLFGYEALLRTGSPALPHPGAVIEAAEKLGKVQYLGRMIRASATESFRAAPEGVALFVNLHAHDLSDEELFSKIAPLSEIADRVVLEITERASLGDIDDAKERVARLRELGFRVAIDDLGAGYAGLTSFALLEPEVVKLDMTLVRDVHEAPMKRKLIKSLSELCRGMGMLVVAEGVETGAERDVLVDLGCDLLQGYLFAKPGHAFPAWSWGSAAA